MIRNLLPALYFLLAACLICLIYSEKNSLMQFLFAGCAIFSVILSSYVCLDSNEKLCCHTPEKESAKISKAFKNTVHSACLGTLCALCGILIGTLRLEEKLKSIVLFACIASGMLMLFCISNLAMLLWLYKKKNRLRNDRSKI
ncbi:MAG TPA: hypothetical protein ENF38_01375 [Candidatus Aenigmarchaeota archaeon]|nr:hypothetical protein [Candidatus Aenigmarchaeota archaeon]